MSEQDTRILAEKLLDAAYARIDALKAELASARSQVRREALEEAAALAARMLVFADTTSSADKEIPAAIRRLAEQEGNTP